MPNNNNNKKKYAEHIQFIHKVKPRWPSMIERRENVIHVFCSVCADCGLRFSDLDSKENQKKKSCILYMCLGYE